MHINIYSYSLLLLLFFLFFFVICWLREEKLINPLFNVYLFIYLVIMVGQEISTEETVSAY